MRSELTRTTVDGVPVIWTSTSEGGPGIVTATLLFRAGERDQAFHEDGLAHLVEHLAFAGRPRIPIPHQGVSGHTFTEFEFTGSPQQVATALHDTCQALTGLAAGELRAARLDHERRILVAEESSAPEVSGELISRFGMLGAGRLAVDSGRQHLIEEADVRRFCARFFTRGNAALALAGEWPPDLALPLPEGRLQPIPDDRLVPRRYPAEWRTDEEITLSWVSPASGERADAVLDASLWILRQRLLSRLRFERPVTYGVDVTILPLSGHRVYLHLDLVAAEDCAADVVRESVEVLRGLRVGGPTEQEIKDYRVETAARGRRPATELVVEAATDELVPGLVGFHPPDRERSATVGAEEVRTFFADVENSLWVCLPGDEDGEVGQRGVVFTVESSPPGWPSDRRQERPIVGERFTRSLRGGLTRHPRDLLLTLGDEGASLRANGVVMRLDWPDVVGLDLIGRYEDRPDDLVLARHDGATMELCRKGLRDFDRAVDLIRQRVPVRLHLSREPDFWDDLHW